MGIPLFPITLQQILETTFIPFFVRDLELSVVSGLESCMYKSDIKVPECYMGFLAPVGKVLSQPELFRNILYGRLIGDEDVVFLFLALLSIPVPTVSIQSLISSKVGVISAVPNHNTIHYLSQ